MKNITLSANEHLIAEARRQAMNEHTTLNAMFREWLEEYVNKQRRTNEAMNTIRDLRAKYSIGGRKFTREEMNERR